MLAASAGQYHLQGALEMGSALIWLLMASRLPMEGTGALWFSHTCRSSIRPSGTVTSEISFILFDCAAAIWGSL